jgi:hypothetical protein
MGLSGGMMEEEEDEPTKNGKEEVEQAPRKSNKIDFPIGFNWQPMQISYTRASKADRSQILGLHVQIQKSQGIRLAPQISRT